MSEKQVRSEIMSLLQTRGPLTASEIFEDLKQKQVSVIEGRVALVSLVAEHEVALDSDFTVSLPEGACI